MRVNTRRSSASWTSALQVGNDRLVGIGRQRQLVMATALPGDGEFAAAPVDVVETKPGNLTTAQPDRRQQDQHRVIPQPGRGHAVARSQHRIDLARR